VTLAIRRARYISWKAVLPTLRRCGDRFRFGFKGEDKWGNPSDQVEAVFALRTNLPVRGLPETISLRRGEHAVEECAVARELDQVTCRVGADSFFRLAVQIAPIRAQRRLRRDAPRVRQVFTGS
jgi:hypothetical protein